MNRNVFIEAQAKKQNVYFMYEGQKRGGRVEMVPDNKPDLVTIFDDLRGAYRSFNLSKMTPLPN